MATRLYGVLLDGLKKPIVNATVVLLAKGNTITVLNGSEAIFKTDAQGAYNVTVQSGYYKVIIGPQGTEPYKAGEIAIYADSQEGSLNNYLVNWAEEDLTPEVIKQVKELVAVSEQYSLQAGRSAAAAQADATDARNSKASAAQSAADALVYKNDSKANADAAKQAQAGAAGSANTAKNEADRAAASQQSASSSQSAAAGSATAAEAARDAALDAQTAAELAEANAKISETNAAESKRLAEAAIDVANSSAGIYQDTTSGLAGTATGGYFSVPSPLDDEVLILYRNDAGIATEVKRYPSAAGVENTRVSMIGVAASLVLTQSIIAAHHAFV